MAEGVIELRLVGIEQAVEVSDIVQTSFRQQAEILGMKKEDFPNYAAFETSEDICKRIAQGEFIVLAYLKEKAIGTVRYKVDSRLPDKGYINRLAVLPDFRGRGYGQHLIFYAESQLKKLKVKIVELSIVAEFKGLKSYYENLGYVSGEEKIVKSLPFSVLFMTRNI